MLKIFILTLLCLSAWTVHGQGQTLFSVPWGEQEYSLTLRSGEESDIIGAVSFTIGEDGLIYVPEGHRKEIKVFDLSGELLSVFPVNIRINHLAVDASGQIFARSDRGVVSAFAPGRKSRDKVEKVQYQLPFSPDIIEGYGQEIHLTGDAADTSRVVGIHTLKGVTRQVFTLEKAGKEVQTRKSTGKAVTRGRPGRDGLHYRSLWKDHQTGVVEVYNNLGTRVDDFEVPLNQEGRLGVFIFKGVDDEGNIFVERERIVNRRAHLEIVVLDNTGQILEIQEIPNEYYSTVYKKTHLHEGTIYQMQTTPQGVEFSRWEVLP